MNKQKGNVKNKLAEHGVFIAKKGILFQLVTALIITLLAGIIAGQHSAISTAAGAVISILPTAIFSGFAFNNTPGMAPDMAPIFDQLCSRLSSDVSIWTQVTYGGDYKSSALTLQY